MGNRSCGWVSALLGVLVAGCASYDGRGLAVGRATETEVVRLMGTPAASWQDPDGRRQLAFTRGPAGLHTYMVILDPAGHLLRIENVLDDAHFAHLRAGQTTRDEVARLLGPPGEAVDFPRRRETVWDYRFRNAWGHEARYYVTFDEQGVVRHTFQLEEFRGDNDREMR